MLKMIGVVMQLLALLTVVAGNPYAAPRQNEMYDFIIVGGGRSGSVLANRLSEIENWKVLLIEAGDREVKENLIPNGLSRLAATGTIQSYSSVPQKTACFGMNDNICLQSGGKVLGGTSSVDYMFYSRGNPCDFDLWAASGATGWSYPEVLPYFLKSEGANLRGLENSVFHNRSGLLSVEDVQFRTKYAHASVQALQQAGHKLNDYNAPFQLGVSYIQVTAKNGLRHSAYRAFLEPIEKERPNLTILTRARVTKILIDPTEKVAYGIEFVHNNWKYFNRASKEVILAAGTLLSPQLLMLSGVGPRQHLEDLGINVLNDLPVGKNLYDHISLGITCQVKKVRGETFFPERFRESDLRRLFAGDPSTIFSSNGGAESLAFLRIPNKVDDSYGQFCCPNRPHFQITFLPLSPAADDGTSIVRALNFKPEIYSTVFKPLADNRIDNINLLITNPYPLSKGEVWLNTTDPFALPLIDPRYYENQKDVETIVESLKVVFDILKQPAYQQLGVKIHNIKVPGCEHFTFDTKSYWKCAVRTLCYPNQQQVGTCRMGASDDPNTVVNSRLQVHGIRKLRVVDGSVIPFPIAARVTAAIYMIAEKAADMIKESWRY